MAQVQRPDADDLIISGIERDVGVSVNSAGEYGAAVCFIPVGQIGATAAEADTEGSLGPDNAPLGGSAAWFV